MPSNSTTPSTSSSSAEHRTAGSLSSAILLALTGGSLDAFIYLNHGHVFAAAMTGNGVLLGASILQHNYIEFIRHLLPILGFAIGILFANLLDDKFQRHSVTVGLLSEISVLLIASFLPGTFPDLLYVPIIAIVAAYQVTSFRKVDTYSYNSTFMTGNLRSAIDGLYDAFHPARRKEGLRKFRNLALIILAFLLGATAGAILAPHLHNHTLWFINLPLVTVLFFVVLSRDESAALQVSQPSSKTN
jgi:uncharacterized membrane protein YoaK (UPF0700 family)